MFERVFKGVMITWWVGVGFVVVLAVRDVLFLGERHGGPVYLV